jgi:diguanylate cyclase (GGDEF)-like protein
MTLDLHTLHFASAASRCAYVGVFLVLALSQRHQTHLWQWMGAMGASMAGSFVMVSVGPDELPPLPVTTVVYWLYGGSLVLAWTGLRSFFGRPVRIGLGLVLAALPGLIYPVLLGLGVPTRLALAAVFACCLVIALLAVFETVRLSAGVERLWAQSIETVAFGSYALVFLFSIGVMIGTDRPVASTETARISMILDQIMGVFIYFGFIAMAAERANRSLLRLAETDPLTGLSNRRGLQKMLNRRFPHPGPGPSGGVLILDIDHFKAINDRHGHEGGDLVLSAFAARLMSVLRSTDMVARWGGEEFLVVLPGIDANELLGVAERLRACIADTSFPLPAGPLAVTVSIGGAVMTWDAGGFEGATRQADAALYEAKAQGRNRVCRAPAAVTPADASAPAVDVALDGLCAA